jgi:hypothetical protein
MNKFDMFIILYSRGIEKEMIKNVMHVLLILIFF